MEQILLDTTTIVTLVSDICNKTEELSKLLPNIKKSLPKQDNNHKLMTIYDEIKDESLKPVMPSIMKVLEGKELVTIPCVINRINKQIRNIFNNSEENRYKELLKKITIIEPAASERINKLNGRRQGPCNKAVYGTADKLKIKLMTGNIKATRNILLANGWNLDIVLHRPRDIIGNKLNYDAT